MVVLPLASCGGGGGASNDSSANKDAEVVALDGTFDTIQAKLNGVNVTAIKVDIYSDKYDDGACLGFSELPSDNSECAAFTVMVNNKNIKSALEESRLVPRIIEKSSYDEKIAKPISSDESLAKKFDAYYTLFDPSAEMTDNERDTMYAQYPITQTGTAVYVLDSSAKERDLQTIEKALDEKTEYSYDNLLEDYVKVQVIPTPKEYLKADVITKDNSDITETEKGIVINSYNGASGAVLVPASIDGKEVFGLGEGAFSSAYVHSVVIEEGVKDISTKAFSRASGLTNVILPSSIEGIGENAFSSAVFTKTENGYKTIFDTVLIDYSGEETQIKIPDTIKHIGGGSFKQNSKITEVIFPTSLESIGDEAFYKCAKLNSADISGTAIKRVGASAFASDARLKSVIISDKVTSVGDKAFFECSDVQTLKLGASVEEIGADAFNNLWLIPDVTLSGSVAVLGDRAFYKCRALKTVSGGDNVKVVGADAFTETPFYNTIKNSGEFGLFGDGVLVTYSGSASEPKIPSTVKYISNAFASNASVKKLVIPDGVTGICTEAFLECKNLAEATVPASVTSIGEYAFKNTADGLTVKVESGSFAESYCGEYHITTSN